MCTCHSFVPVFDKEVHDCKVDHNLEKKEAAVFLQAFYFHVKKIILI